MDAYNRILEAARTNKQVRLSAAEVRALALDDAIAERAIALHEQPRLWQDQLNLVQGKTPAKPNPSD